MTEQFTRAGYTFTPTRDPDTLEPGPLHVAKDGHSVTVQPDFLEGRDDVYVAETLGAVFAQLPGDAP